MPTRTQHEMCITNSNKKKQKKGDKCEREKLICFYSENKLVFHFSEDGSDIQV